MPLILAPGQATKNRRTAPVREYNKRLRTWPRENGGREGRRRDGDGTEGPLRGRYGLSSALVPVASLPGLGSAVRL